MAAPATAGRNDVYVAPPFAFANAFSDGRAVLAAVADGRVHLSGGQAFVEHRFLAGHEVGRVLSRLSGCARYLVASGAVVRRGQALARAQDCTEPVVEQRLDAAFKVTAATAVDEAWPHAEVLEMRRFAAAHQQLFDPSRERQLVLIDQEHYRLALYTGGKLARDVQIGLGQASGQKRRLHDLRTPKGMYFVVDKIQGAMSGQWAAYYGGYWIKINYPGPEDARWGLDNGVIDAATAGRITQSWGHRDLTPQNTGLGGGVGFHGWASEWDGDGGARLSFGCVVFHPADIAAMYPAITPGIMVIIY